jgi:hypothetical protein
MFLEGGIKVTAIIHKVLECERSCLGELCFSGIRIVQTIIIIVIIIFILKDRCLSDVPIIIIFKDYCLSTILVIIKLLPGTT